MEIFSAFPHNPSPPSVPLKGISKIHSLQLRSNEVVARALPCPDCTFESLCLQCFRQIGNQFASTIAIGHCYRSGCYRCRTRRRDGISGRLTSLMRKGKIQTLTQILRVLWTPLTTPMMKTQSQVLEVLSGHGIPDDNIFLLLYRNFQWSRTIFVKSFQKFQNSM